MYPAPIVTNQTKELIDTSLTKQNGSIQTPAPIVPIQKQEKIDTPLNKENDFKSNIELNNRCGTSITNRCGITKKELLNLFDNTPGRIDMLPVKDRAFINLFMSAQNFRTIAINAGVHEATIARRLKKIADRIKNDSFIFAISNKKLSKLKIEVLKDYFVNGMSMIQIAKNRKLSYYEVRKIIKESIGHKDVRM